MQKKYFFEGQANIYHDELRNWQIYNIGINNLIENYNDPLCQFEIYKYSNNI